LKPWLKQLKSTAVEFRVEVVKINRIVLHIKTQLKSRLKRLKSTAVEIIRSRLKSFHWGLG
jgi:hypothetical protein